MCIIMQKKKNTFFSEEWVSSAIINVHLLTYVVSAPWNIS